MDAQRIFTVADEILSSDPEAAAVSFATVLTDVFGNDSFTENVIDGGDTRLFEENLSKVSLSVSKIEEVALKTPQHLMQPRSPKSKRNLPVSKNC